MVRKDGADESEAMVKVKGWLLRAVIEILASTGSNSGFRSQNQSIFRTRLREVECFKRSALGSGDMV